MSSNNNTGPQNEFNLAALSKDDWTEYRARIDDLDPLVAPMIGEFLDIREKQRQYVLAISRLLEQLPRGGDLFHERLDMAAHMRLQEALADGDVTLKDFERWKMDVMITEPTTVETVVLTDGSISMRNILSKGGARKIDTAFQLTAALREAGKFADIDNISGLWGSDGITMLAAPGDSDEEVGKNFQANRSGLVASTKLSPSFNNAIELLSTQETSEDGKPRRFAGMTHFLIISDGGLDKGDFEPLLELLTTLFRYGPAVSVDIAVLGDDDTSPMHDLVEAVKADNPGAAIGIINSDDANKIPGLLLDRVKERFDASTGEVQGIPDAAKREKFKTVADLLNMRPG